MAFLNFNKQFAVKVQSGQKLCSIRQKARGKVGETLHLFTGMRTKNCRRLGEGVITHVMPFFIVEEDDGQVGDIYLDGVALSDAQVLALAQLDGFATVAEFVGWFRDTHGLPFDGVLHRWTLKGTEAAR